MELRELCTDTDLESTGVWVDSGGVAVREEMEGRFDMRIGSMRGRAYQHARYKALAEHQVGNLTELGPEAGDKIQVELFVDHILLGWRNLTHKGKDIPYSKEAARRLLSEQRPILDLVTAIAMSSEIFLARNVDALAKNLLSASNGMSALAVPSGA
jgi:hypothetical protein